MSRNNLSPCADEKAMRTLPILAAAAIVVAALFALAAGPRPVAASADFAWDIPAWLPPPAVPADNPMSGAKVKLGRHLFYDARLSRDGTMACSSCHEQSVGFTDGRALAVGINANETHRNAMGLANVAYMPVLTWANPHMTSLEFQALVPLFGEDPVEMGSAGREQEIFARLAADPLTVDLFAAAFPDRGDAVGPEISLYTITRALAAFQRTLISADSPYDRFKYGSEPEAITPAAKRGEDLFFSHRFECYHCHQGFNFSDNLKTSRSAFAETAFHNTGLYNIAGRYPAHASGLSEFTGRAADEGAFRTPTLRNIAVTAPYFHDGSAATLDDVLDHYAAAGRTIADGSYAGIGARHPNKSSLVVGFTLSERERADLKAFLESLTDETFLTDPAFSDPWPKDHPARANRRSALPQPQ
ncbi:MAG: MbnH family di-heme enzyme [Pseudomonadota bacterium]